MRYLLGPARELALLAGVQRGAAVAQVREQQAAQRLGGRQRGAHGRAQQRPVPRRHARHGLRVLRRLRAEGISRR